VIRQQKGFDEPALGDSGKNFVCTPKSEFIMSFFDWFCGFHRKNTAEAWARGQLAEIEIRAERLFQGGKYAEALPLAEQAAELANSLFGKDHPDYATFVNNLAVLHGAMGNNVAAERLCQQACAIQRKVLGEDHPNYACSLYHLALAYEATGNYPAAEPLYEQACAICRKALGEDHPNYANCLNNLAGLYWKMGNYPAAEPLYQQARAIRRKVLGEEHPDYAASLSGLAVLYREMGNYPAAEPLLQQACEIYRKILGEDHPYYAASLNHLAVLYQEMGNYPAAEPLLQQACAIRRKVLSEEHPDYAESLNNLAVLYQEMGNYPAAEPLYQRACEIGRKVLGEEHPNYARSLDNLAVLYRDMGNYAAAETLCQQACEINRKNLGEEHTDYAHSLNNLAVVYAATGRAVHGLQLMQNVAAIQDRLIGQVLCLGSESQCLAYLQHIRGYRDAYLSLVNRHLNDSPEAVRSALDLVLRRKALVAESLAAQRHAVLGGKYPRLEPILQDLTMLRRQIAQKWFSGPGPEGLAAHQALLQEWTRRKELLEKELAQQIPEMALQQQLAAADRRAVALGLPEGVALAEFVRFDVYDFQAVPARGERRWQPARYLAFVLPHGQPDEVRMIDLGEADEIDFLISLFRQGITGKQMDEDQRGPVAPKAEITSTSAGLLLRKKVFDPLSSALAGGKRLMLAPDGDLTRLPFEVLPGDDGDYLLDSYEISYLATGRDVLRFRAAPTGQATVPVIAANPDYDLADNPGTDGPAGSPEVVAGPACDRNSVGPNRSSRAPEWAQLYFSPLPATKKEGATLADMLGQFLHRDVELLMEANALETRLKAAPSPWILHLATHGFFLPDQPYDPGQGLRNLELVGSSALAGMGGAVALENPLLRSGLALASANWKCKGFRPPPAAEDGQLTAEDVIGLDLLHTELVVLSACDTGLGQVHVGEGVYGLRRAFALAGAKTLVMSLWKVPDAATQELMVHFYTYLLAGQGRAEALRSAQRDVKQKYPHPLYWGAFICQGDPSPLPAVTPA
jgi:CHAT domain-containing protein